MKTILTGPIVFAMFQAAAKFAGRNRRRIKREVNKAARKARKNLLSRPGQLIG